MGTNPLKLKYLILVIAGTAIFLIAGAGGYLLFNPLPSPNYPLPSPNHPLPSPTPVEQDIHETADCAWSGKVYAWLDENENGLHEVNEPPLSNVTFFVDDTLNDYQKVSKYAVSNLQGEASVGVWLPGCPKVELEIYPEVPSDYRLTTPGRTAVDELALNKLFIFGFAYLPGIPTATSRPVAPMACSSFLLTGELEYNVVEDLRIEPDGTLWGIASPTGAFHFDPANQNWMVYTEQNGLPSSNVYSVSVAPNGIVWFATNNGVASFDGSTWVTHVPRDGLNSTIRDVDVLFPSNDNIWVTTTEGAYRLDPKTNHQINSVLEGERYAYHITHSTLTSDGMIWGVNRDFIFQLDTSSPQTWIRRSIPNEVNNYGAFSVENIVASSDGALWLMGTSSATSGVIRFDANTNEWTAYNHLTTNGALLGEGIYSSAIGPDNSIWLGTYGNGVVQIRPAQSNKASNAEVTYYMESELINGDGISAIAFAPDKTVWFGSEGKIIHCTVKWRL